MNRYRIITILAFAIGLAGISCNKEWLDVKSNKSLVVPSTIEDFQALMDNTSIMNTAPTLGIQQMAEVGTDNYFVENNTWEALGATALSLPLKNAYIFSAEIFTENADTWNTPYLRIFYANVVLDGLSKIDPDESKKQLYNKAKGSALFTRAYAFFWLSQIFAPPYNAATAIHDKGIPLRLTSDRNLPTTRASVEQTYQQIIADLTGAISLLPIAPDYKTQPSRAAALALLARVYLVMNDYEKAFTYADASLSDYGTLLDLTSMSSSATYPLPLYNDEVIYSDINGTIMFAASRCRIDTFLYASFSDDDLRKKFYFKRRSNTPYYTFNGNYTGSSQLFGGIATDEVLLTRAECYARKNQPQLAMNDLNALLIKRWSSNAFVPFTASTGEAALTLILQERRKELCFRGLRWCDLRRLNKYPDRQTTVTRILTSGTYRLLPDSKRYTYPIPPPVISMTGIEQNER